MNIKRYLLSKNIQPQFKGFEYLVLAIQLCQEQNSVKDIHKKIYPKISELTTDKVQNIERCIRHAISKSYTPVITSKFLARALLELEEN